MLVLTRKRTESIKIGEDIVVTVIHTSAGSVKLGIQAPANVRVLRAELSDRPVAPVAAVTHVAPMTAMGGVGGDGSPLDEGEDQPWELVFSAADFLEQFNADDVAGRGTFVGRQSGISKESGSAGGSDASDCPASVPAKLGCGTVGGLQFRATIPMVETVAL